MEAPVLYEDRDVLAVAKPAGVVVIPARNEDAALSLRHRLEALAARSVQNLKTRGQRAWPSSAEEGATNKGMP